MLTKVLVTTLVIVVMLMVARSGVLNPQARRPASGRTPPQAPEKTLFPKVAALVVLLMVIALGGLLFYLDWREDHRIIDIRVTSPGSGATVIYQAYRHAIEGRRFTTLDGRAVTLSDAERVEMTEAP